MNIQLFMHIIERFGMAGLVLTMLLEGLSVPFPGMMMVITLGYILNLNTAETFLVAALMSFIYSIGSYIPYVIGFKLDNVIRKKYEKPIKAIDCYFKKYGEYSIAFLRPFALGNYISYFAGMSKTKLWKYFALTFTGIYPWSLAMLFIGRITKGNLDSSNKLIQSYTNHIYILILCGIIVCICGLFYKRFYHTQKAAKQRSY